MRNEEKVSRTSQSLIPCLPPQRIRTCTPRSVAPINRSKTVVSTNLGCCTSSDFSARSMKLDISTRELWLLQSNPEPAEGAQSDCSQSALKPSVIRPTLTGSKNKTPEA